MKSSYQHYVAGDISPRNVLSLRPTDSVMDKAIQNCCDTVHLYVDMKNILTSLYYSGVSSRIVADSEVYGSLSSVIFQSLIILYSDWKEKCVKNNLKLKMFIFSDTHKSMYHLQVDKDYKKDRSIASSSMLSEEILEIRRRNTELAYNVLNRLDDVYVFYLMGLESDFLPYWLITRKFKDQENVFHVTLSNDKDMFQILLLPRTYQMYKMKGQTNEIDGSNVLYKYYKLDAVKAKSINSIKEGISNMNKNYLLASMALSGDAVDNVPGLPRVKERTSMYLVGSEDIARIVIGTPEELQKRIDAGGFFLNRNIPFHDPSQVGDRWKKLYDRVGEDEINRICTNSYKLISYESLCRWLENFDKLEKDKIIKEIDKVLDKSNIKRIPSSRIFLESISKLRDCKITEREVNNLF